MKKSRFTEEQIAFALRQAEGGAMVRDVCRKMGVSEQTYYRWRKEYGGLKTDQAKKLKELERKNARLKRLLVDAELDKAFLKEAASGNY